MTITDASPDLRPLDFVPRNGQRAKVSFRGVGGHLPLAPRNRTMRNEGT